MENEIIAVGIDVAKSSLSVCFHLQNGNEKALMISNNETDINQKILVKLKDFKGKIVMESTGHYHWLVALLLSESGYDIRVVNPILASQYTTKNIRKVKSDSSDASGLARMARIADNLPNTFYVTRESLWMRKKLGLLSSLSKQVQALQASIKSVKEAQKIIGKKGSLIVDELENQIKSLKKSMKNLEKECIEESRQNSENEKKIELLTSVPGISEFVAILCLHWFNRNNGNTAKSWVAYSGNDVSVKESGTWKGKCQLTKRGNSYLRKRLFCCVFGAWRHNADFKNYYDKLKDEGRSYAEIMIIISRKLIRIMFKVLEKNEFYDAQKCFLSDNNC